MIYRLRILPRAEADLQDCHDWLQERSPAGAKAWYAAFHAAAVNVLKNPHGCTLARENDLFEHEVRQFPFKTRRGRIYRAVYTVVDEEVRILRVRGPGQRDLKTDELGEIE